jgi:hypothetical protein
MGKDGDSTSVHFFSSKTDGFPRQGYVAPLKLRRVAPIFFIYILILFFF